MLLQALPRYRLTLCETLIPAMVFVTIAFVLVLFPSPTFAAEPELVATPVLEVDTTPEESLCPAVPGIDGITASQGMAYVDDIEGGPFIARVYKHGSDENDSDLVFWPADGQSDPVRFELPLGHGNGMSWDSATGRLYISTGISNTDNPKLTAYSVDLATGTCQAVDKAEASMHSNTGVSADGSRLYSCGVSGGEKFACREMSAYNLPAKKKELVTSSITSGDVPVFGNDKATFTVEQLARGWSTNQGGTVDPTGKYYCLVHADFQGLDSPFPGCPDTGEFSVDGYTYHQRLTLINLATKELAASYAIDCPYEVEDVAFDGAGNLLCAVNKWTAGSDLPVNHGTYYMQSPFGKPLPSRGHAGDEDVGAAQPSEQQDEAGGRSEPGEAAPGEVPEVFGRVLLLGDAGGGADMLPPGTGKLHVSGAQAPSGELSGGGEPKEDGSIATMPAESLAAASVAAISALSGIVACCIWLARRRGDKRTGS